MATAATLLTAVEDAIATLLANPKSYVKVGEGEYRYQDLDVLRKMRDGLKGEVSSATSTGGRNYARFSS